MLITIITPSLNYGRYLYDCLESVAKQSGSTDATNAGDGRAARSPSIEIEHIVIDGGSTDGSAEIASGFPHVTWICEPDNGMSDAINKGFDRARGEWVMWLNADDRLKPDALARAASFLAESNADLVYGDWDFIAEDGSLLRHVRPPRWSMFVHIYHHCFIGSTAAFLRRSSILDQGFRLRADFRYVMDGELYARLSASGKIFERVPVTIADFRLHAQNASHRHLLEREDLGEILAAEKQHVESRALRRKYGVTLFRDPYLNGFLDGIMWVAARIWKQWLKI